MLAYKIQLGGRNLRDIGQIYFKFKPVQMVACCCTALAELTIRSCYLKTIIFLFCPALFILLRFMYLSTL